MKSSASRLSVGLVGFLPNETHVSCGPRRALVGHPENAPKSDHEPDRRTDQNPPFKAHDRASCSVAPDSRRPLISPEVREKIEAIEQEARAKRWPPELLWSGGFWACPRGLAAVLDANDEIVEVTGEFITILKTKRDLIRFRRYSA